MIEVNNCPDGCMLGWLVLGGETGWPLCKQASFKRFLAVFYLIPM
jgi:hypothetical protein